MHLSLMPKTEIALNQALILVGGCTESIFPKVEAMLINSSDYQRSLHFVAKWKKMDRYKSVIDFMFCELFPEYRDRCFKFYEASVSEPQLKDVLTPGEVVYYGNLLVKALEIAYEMFCNKRSANWTKFRYAVLREAA